MVEAEGDLGFGGGLEGLAVPLGDDASGAEAEDEGLLREGNGGGPLKAEGAEIRDGGDGTAGGVGGQFALAREFDQLVVTGNQLLQGAFVGVA